jgi:hypothetical protein
MHDTFRPEASPVEIQQCKASQHFIGIPNQNKYTSELSIVLGEPCAKESLAKRSQPTEPSCRKQGLFPPAPQQAPLEQPPDKVSQLAKSPHQKHISHG